MTKPTRPLLSVRAPVDPAAAEAFLAGKPFPAPSPAPDPPAPAPAAAEAAPPPSAPTPPAPTEPTPAAASAPSTPAEAATPSPALSGRRVHERKDGRRVRRTTILMREDLARRLDLFAAGRGVDKTAVYQEAIEAWLAAHGG